MDVGDKTLSEAEQQLLGALGGLSESISFCASGVRPLVLPGLKVDGIGEIAFPVSKSDARSLIKQASQAPYGRGTDTVVDPNVRRVWQLEPNQFQLKNPKWESFIHDVTNAVRSEFGIKQKATAELYKLLVYEKDSFFVPHRDTEKSPRMFATLVICLPSMHQGGQLIVSHAGNSQVVDFSENASSYELQYAAFYADCHHEVRPVTSGYRVCLVYNLATSGRQEQPAAPESNSSIAVATNAVKKILADDGERDMIVVPLLHQYSEAGLVPDDIEDDDLVDEDDEDEWDEEDDDYDDYDYEEDDKSPEAKHTNPKTEESSTVPTALVPLEFKGADRARADVLSKVAASTNCRAFVALLTHWQSGYPDYSTVEYMPYGGYRDYGHEDVSSGNERAEFEEVFDESISLRHWHALDGRRQPFDKLEIDENDIVCDVEHKERPYRQELHEATGNAGMSMERWYHQAVIVLWPESRHFHILARQGAKNSVPALAELVATAEDPRSCRDCKEFAKSIVDHWVYSFDRRSAKPESLGTSLMRSLLALGDAKLAKKFFEQVLPLEYGTLDGELLVALAELAQWKSLKKPLLSFYQGRQPIYYEDHLAELVATFGALAALGAVPAERKQVCKSLLPEVNSLLDRWEKSESKTKRGYVSDFRASEFGRVVEPLLRGVCAVGTRSDLQQVMKRITAKPKLYDLHKGLIPAVNAIASDPQFMKSGNLAATAERDLRQFCIHELTQRTAKQPAPPKNWKRSANLECKCADCQELTSFLQDKDAQVHRFPRRTDLRQHLHQQIDHHRIDCTHVTERRGRPYTLVCTKTQASFERELKQYRTDCDVLKELTPG